MSEMPPHPTSDRRLGGLGWGGGHIRSPKRRLLSDRVAEQIERIIQEQGLAAGDRLPAGRDLAQTLGVSRTVIRDAIAVLEQRGLLESRPGSGVFVANGSSEAVEAVFGQMLRLDAISFDEIAELRHLLEVHNAVGAVERAGADDVDRMEATILAMRQARTAMSFVEADVAFHQEIAGAAGNRVVMAVLASLRPLLLQSMLIGTRLQGARDASVVEHSAILAAIAGGDPEAARTCMAAHLAQSDRERYSVERDEGTAQPEPGLPLPRPE